MKRLSIQLSAVILLLLSFSFNSIGADNYTLEFNLEKGKTYVQNMVSVMNVKMNVMGQDMDMDINAETSMKYDVEGQNDGIFTLQASFTKIKTKMDSPMAFTLDSEFPEKSTDTALGETFKSFIGVPVVLQLSKQGKVVSVEGTEKLTEKINAITNAQYRQMIEQQFSNKMLQGTFQQIAPYFPNKQVAIGDSWDAVLNQHSNGVDIINKMKFTLKEVKNNVATLDCTGTLSTPEGGIVINMQGMEATASINGENAGTILVDMKSGWIIKSEITQKFIQDVEVMGQAMKQNIEVKMTITAE